MSDDEDAHPDERGDPTERDERGDADPLTEDADARDADPTERDDAEEAVDASTARPSPEVPPSGEDADPLADLDDADSIEESPFEEMDVDADAVDAADVFATAEETADADPDTPDTPDADADGDARIISDRTCHNCEFFADPPDLACTHEGTDIRRVVDTDHYEVVNCPMVLDDVDIVENL